jgi:hypothetical protein
MDYKVSNVSYYQVAKITQFLICIVLSLLILIVCPWEWLRESLAVLLGWRVFGFLRKRLKVHILPPVPVSSRGDRRMRGVVIFMLFSGVMSFFIIIAVVVL